MHLHSEKTTNKKQTDIPMEYIANVKNILLAFPVWFITSSAPVRAPHLVLVGYTNTAFSKQQIKVLCGK